MYLNYRELDANIIIIGAGIAGLSAAYHLLEKDPHIDFLILDVDDKIDFSIRNKYSSLWNMKWASTTKVKKKTKFAEDNFQTDFQFLFPKQTNLLNILEKLDIQILKNELQDGKILVDYDKLYEVSKRDNILEFLSKQDRSILNEFCKQIDGLCKIFSFDNHIPLPEFDDISMNIFLNRLIPSKKVRDVITQSFLFNSGLQPKDVSASFFLAICNSTQGIQNQFIWNEKGIHQFYMEGGVENMRSKMMDFVENESIVKVSEIAEISWDQFCAGIRTPHEYFFANKVIFTLNETETNNINFVPPLSDEKRIVANNFVRGTLKKFLVNYTKPFWLNKGLSGDVYVMNTDERNGPIYICLNISKLTDENYMLTGLAEEGSDKNEILNQLKLYFGEEATNPENYVEISSSLHELSFPYGCTSMKYFENIRKNTERIVWASPETATSWYGTAAGSVEAGFKGAIRALQETKPNTLTMEDLNYISPDDVNIPSRMLGFFGIQWHILIPTVLVIVYAVVKVKRYFSKKLLK